jgi:hypothetical protein
MISFANVLTDLEGQPIKDIAAGLDGQPRSVDMTLGRACANALLAPLQDETGKVSGSDHVKRLALAMKVHAAGELDLPAEDVALLKERVAKVYTTPLVVGRCWLLLDPACAG